jgi:hypothetical protein
MNADHPSVGSPIASPIGHWKFDEGYGTIANSSGSCATCSGTLNSMASPATTGSGWNNHGKLSKALSFDGSNDYVRITDNRALQITNNFSLSFWLKSNSTSQTNKYLFAKNNTAGTNQWGIIYEYVNDAIEFFAAGSGYSGTDPRTNSQITVSDTNWHHISYTYNGSTWSGYKDGTRIFSVSRSFSLGQLSGLDFFVGAANNTPDAPVNAVFDDIKIYNYGLSSDEVKLEYNQGKTIVLGALSTEADGITASNSAARAYCPPGDTSTCNPPVAHWTLDERQGTSANDITGNANTGTLTNGPIWTPGKIGQSLLFDGTNDYIDLPTVFSIATGDFTFSSWISKSSATGNVESILARGGNHRGAMLYVDTDGEIKFAVRSAPANLYTISSNIVADRQWRHVSGVWENSNLSLYVDGALTATASGSVFDSEPSEEAEIGADRTGSVVDAACCSNTDYFKGFIDDTRIYDYARTPAQIAWDYNQGKPVAHYKLDECSGLTAYDSSGNRNNGTISIGATGSQTSAGTCETVNTATAWYNGSEGKFNSSLSFDGTNDYVDLPTVFNIATGDFTLAAWISKSSSTGDVESILARGGNHRGALIYVDSDGIIKFAVRNEPNTVNIVSSGITANTQWRHVVGIWENNTLYLYVDGIFKASTAGTSFDSEPSEAAEIGADIEGSVVDGACCSNTDYFKGLIDDARIYAYALTPAQVKLAYNEGSAIRFGPSEGSP